MVAPEWGKYNYSKTRNLRTRKPHRPIRKCMSGNEIQEKGLPGREDLCRRICEFTFSPEELQVPAQAPPVVSLLALISFPAARSLVLHA